MCSSRACTTCARAASRHNSTAPTPNTTSTGSQSPTASDLSPMGSRSMRHADGVTHLLHVFSTFAIGGPQTRFVTLANRLGGKYRHTVISLDGDIGCASRLDPSVDAQVTVLRLSKGGGLHLGNLMRIRRRLA